ncbi:MAG: helix-turn-helix domain-containing protein [Lachnospiraceae bacterium]
MSKTIIANFLKQLRKTSGLSVDEVIEGLQKYGIMISTKTLYGYENGTSMLNADVFVALCRIYKCDNPMDLFGNTSIKPPEIGMMEKYRALDPHGKEMVDFTLQKEWERSTAEAEKANVVPMTLKEDTPDYLKPQAAHPHAGTEEELSLMREDISNLKRPE